ncbi:hypothetical protein [Geodermatophilus sp. DF01-2]|uniref:hypothetical protein n=1 Tax=Geodermatophilus sp. DF01-2 TaxID=2559610 RepID=UPI001FD7A939|nr:hypothetical protein [Geodermatophilus sp. DF01_2]
MTDVSSGAWIAESLRPAPGTVAALVPPVFGAYAPVLHPAYRYVGDDDVEVTWAEVAAANGTVAHPLVQWAGITGGWEYHHEDSQPPTWDGAPAEGHLPVAVADRLARVLARHTGTPGECWFGRWDGFGYDVPGHGGASRLALPGGHDVVLVRGTVRDASRNLAPEPHEQSANLWWPADRAWLVTTDIDLVSTYVGGSAACIADLASAPDLEVAPASPDDRVGRADDPLNPVPEG